MTKALNPVLMAIVLLASAVAVDAQPVTSDDAKCRSAFQKNLSKYDATIHKTIAGCWKNVLKGKQTAASTDCNRIFGMGGADSKGKAAKAKDKLIAAIGGGKSKCDDTVHATALAEFAGGCPSPAAGPITTWIEARDCAIAITEFQAEQVWAYAFDPPVEDVDTISADKDLLKCATGFHKAAIKLAARAGKERGKAQASSDKSGSGSYDFTNGNADPKQKIAGSRQKLLDAIDKNCAPKGFALSTARLATLNSCRTDIDGLKNCLAGPWERNGSGVTSMAYEQAGICPASVTLQIDAGKGGGTRLNATRLDTGWTGLGHDVDVSDGFVGSITLTCDDGTCGSCTPTLRCDAAAGNCRCSNDVTTICTTAIDADSACIVGDTGGPAPVACTTNADCSYCTRSSGVDTVSGCNTDADCTDDKCSNNPADDRTCVGDPDCQFCTGDESVSCSTNGDCTGIGACNIGTCRLDNCAVGQPGPTCLDNQCVQDCEVHFGPPLPLNASNTPICAVNKIPSELLSVVPIDVGAGSSTTGVNSVSVISTGISQEQPCPTCTGANLGEAGTCSGGSRDTLPCTTNGTHPAFGNTSYDCPPDSGANITGAGLLIGLTFSDAPAPLAEGTDCTFASGASGLTCACAVCTGGGNLQCNGDADCPGTETCTGIGSGNDTQPNACSDLVCDAGECTAGAPSDIVRYCDNYLRGDGQGILICSSNTDCVILDPICPGGNCGKCALVTTRKCFTSGLGGTIPIPGGQAGTDGAVLASGFCVPPTGSSSVNSATGLPGPARLATTFRYTPRCADGVTPWQFPGGSNCQ